MKIITEKEKASFAIFGTSYSNLSMEVTDYNMRNYSILSHKVEIEFIPLSEEQQIKNRLAILDKEQAEIREEAMEKLNRIEEAKKELLAITFQQ